MSRDAAEHGLAAGGALRRELRLRDLVAFHVTAILSVRWISLAAARGPASLVLWVAAGLLFFAPLATAVLSLSRTMPEEGGIYRWTRAACGPFHGFFCAWCYVASNLVYFPALLLTVAGYLRQLLGVGENQAGFTLAVTLGGLWLVLVIHVLGLRVGKWLQNVGALALWIPCGLLIALAAWSWIAGDGAAASAASSPAAPGASVALDLGTLGVWSQLCFGFAGLELASVMAGEIRDPERAVPRSVWIAGGVVTAIYLLGTVALLHAVPSGSIDPVAGILQGIQALLERRGLGWLSAPVGVLLCLGALGAVGAWLAGSARLPYVIGLDRYLPASLTRLHPRTGVPHRALLVQGGVATAITVLSLAGTREREAYALLNAAATLLYFVPFLYLFVTLWRLRPGPVSRVAAGVGLAATAAAIVLAMVPEPGVDATFGLLRVIGGSAVLALVCVPLYLRARRRDG